MMSPRLLLAPAAFLFVAACGGASSGTEAALDPSSRSGSHQPAATDEKFDSTRYCRLTQRLERAGEKVFADLGRNATPAQYEAAERRFVLESSDVLDALAEASPPPLAEDVDVLLTGMRQRAGLVEGVVTAKEASQSERRILAFERRHC